MCGRFVASTPTSRIVEIFGIEDVAPEAVELRPSWNVAPSTRIGAVVWRDGRRRLEVVRWGLVPSWADSAAVGAKMVNARAEGLSRSRAFRGALAGRRAIIVMDGFYEWRSEPGGRQPYYFSSLSGDPLAVAGLWEQWRDPEGAWLLSAAIVTCGASGPVAAVHDRMPVVLGAASLGDWLDSEALDSAGASELLAEHPEVALVSWPVDKAVNKIANDFPDLVRRAGSSASPRP